MIWGGINFGTVNGEAKSTLNLTTTDATAYYNLLDNTFWLTLDAGVTLRNIQGYAEVKSGDVTAMEEFKDIRLPLAYLRTRVNIPMTGLGFEAIGKGITYQGNEFLEYKANINYTTPFGLGVDLGYAQKKLITTEDSELKVDLDLKGPYVGINWKF